jgi:hypothetical protein
MRRILPVAGAAIAAALALAAPAFGATSCPKPPDVDSSNFVTQVDNPYFPLNPGTTFRYKGTEDGEKFVDEMTVTHDTKEILGVTTTVVHDQVFSKGHLVEDTLDWYGQDKDDTIWYFGEDTKELDKNGDVISTEGSWEAGVDGANAGIFIPGDPKVGQVFKQEDANRVAEDCAEILDLNASVETPYVSSDHALKTKEFSLLEKGVVDNKFYVPDVGLVREVRVKGGDEVLELVSVKTG